MSNFTDFILTIYFLFQGNMMSHFPTGKIILDIYPSITSTANHRKLYYMTQILFPEGKKLFCYKNFLCRCLSNALSNVLAN